MFYLLAQSASKKTVGSLMIFLLLSELIIGGVLLPYKENQRAQAIFADWIGGIAGIGNFIEGIAGDAAAAAGSAYESAGTWASAAVDYWNKSQGILKEALLVAWNVLRKKLLNMLVDDIVAWIQGGGKPRFVTDWQNFLKTAADKAAGQFISQNLGAGFLCGPFALKLQIALAKPPTFDESVTCTLSKITRNIDTFFSDFSNGGWTGWLTVSEPQNNIFGADLMALDKKYDLMAKAQEAAKNEAGSSAGFLGDKVCVQRQCPNRATNQPGRIERYSGSSGGWKPDELDQGDGNSCECLQWETRTPGRVAGDALQKATGVDIDNLISAKEFAAYAGAIIDAVINRVAKEGVALMKPSPDGTSAGKTGPGIDSPATVSVNTSSYAGANTDSATTQTLSQQQKLLKENLTKNLAEYQKNLDILNQIKTAQENSIRVLQQSITAGCSLPGGSSVGQETITIQGNCLTACPCESVTTKTRPFTIDGMGSGTLKQIVTNRYTTEANWLGLSTCTTLTYSATDSSIINSSLSSIAQITTTQTEMQALQARITQINTVIANTVAYQTSIPIYMTAYENWQKGDLTAATSTAETAMKAAKQTATASNQAALSTSATDFNEFNQQTMQKTTDTIRKVSEMMTSRGGVTDCSFAQAGLYRDLCAAQAKESEIQNNYTNCLSSGGSD